MLGHIIRVGDQTFHMALEWDVQLISGRYIFTHPTNLGCILYNPDGKVLAYETRAPSQDTVLRDEALSPPQSDPPGIRLLIAERGALCYMLPAGCPYSRYSKPTDLFENMLYVGKRHVAVVEMEQTNMATGGNHPVWIGLGEPEYEQFKLAQGCYWNPPTMAERWLAGNTLYLYTGAAKGSWNLVWHEGSWVKCKRTRLNDEYGVGNTASLTCSHCGFSQSLDVVDSDDLASRLAGMYRLWTLHNSTNCNGNLFADWK